METEKARKISAVGIVFAVLLAAGITYAGNSVFTSLSGESREVNRDFAIGNYTNPLKINASAVFPRAVDADSYYFFMNVTFAIILPSDASCFTGNYVVAAFGSGSNPYLEYDKSIASGDEDFFPVGEIVVKGEPMGGTGIGLWNVTLWMDIFKPPTLGVSQNQSWLSFTTQVEAHLSIALECGYNMTAVSGTNYSYGLYPLFNFPGTNATFYVFRYPVGAWFGYGSSVLIIVASLFLLDHEARRKYAETLRRSVASDA
jgi:hypothetical protein